MFGCHNGATVPPSPEPRFMQVFVANDTAPLRVGSSHLHSAQRFRRFDACSTLPLRGQCFRCKLATLALHDSTHRMISSACGFPPASSPT